MSSLFTFAFAVSGFMSFGLRGMIVGLLLGHFIDFMASIRIKQNGFLRQSRAELNRNIEALLRSLSTTCGRLASIDLPQTSIQVDAFKTALAQFRLKPRFQMECLRLFTLGPRTPGAAAHTPLSFHESVIQLANLVALTEFPPRAVYDVMKAVVDARPNTNSKRALRIAGELMGLGENCGADDNSGRRAESRSRTVSSGGGDSDPYSILGCQRSDDLNSIKRRYHELLKEYHPDQIQSLQLPSGFVQFANEQVRRLTDAYQVIAAEKARS